MPPMCSASQCKALLLIALLAGHEAARVQQEAKSRKLAGGGGRQVGEYREGQGKDPNDRCTMGPAGCDTNAGCAYRPLPLEVLTYANASASCKLSDDYMLKHDRAKYLKYQTELLAQKSEEYAATCNINEFVGMACKHKAMEMMRAMEFMSKAQDKALRQSMTEGERAAERELIGAALGRLVGAVGPDAAPVQELARKLAGDTGGARRDPKGTVVGAITLVYRLLHGTRRDKAAARRDVAAMPEPPVGGSPEDDGLGAGLDELSDKLEQEADEVRHVMDRVNALDPPQESPEEGDEEVQHRVDRVNALWPVEMHMAGALIEKGNDNELDSVELVRRIVVVVIIGLVVMTVVNTALWILSSIITWALVSVLGCGVYVKFEVSDFLQDFINRFNGQTPYKDVLKCAERVFALPFKLIGRAVSALCQVLGICGADGRVDGGLAGGVAGDLASHLPRMPQLRLTWLQLEDRLQALNGTGPVEPAGKPE